MSFQSLALADTMSLVSRFRNMFHDEPAQETKPSTVCGQSPINLVLADINQTGNDKLHFKYSPRDGLHLDNNGQGIQVNGEFGSLKLPDGEYRAKQLRFHFPSEHEVNGKLASGEIQIVHEKVTNGTGLAVIGILLQEKGLKQEFDRTKELAFLQNLGFGGSLPAKGEARPITDAVDIAGSFDQELEGGFYHYQGSSTAEQCSAATHWYVLKEPSAVTWAMVRNFKTLFPDPSNNRPVQALAGRTVVQNEVSVPGEWHESAVKNFKEKSATVSHAASWLLAFLLGGATALLA